MKPSLLAPAPRLRRWRLNPLPRACAAACLGLAGLAWATPQGGQVVHGQAQIQAGTGRMDIVQGTDKAIIDWKSFSLQTGEVLRIQQPGAGSVLLNRVVGLDPSILLGRIEANGRVFLSNPRGILFGAGAQVDAGSFTASTLGISNADFLAGRYQFNAEGTPGRLQMDGRISARETVALIAPELAIGATGQIDARRVGLAAASSVLVDVEGDGLILFNARNDGLQARLDMLGQVRADGGTAEIRAQARAGFADTVLNLDGIVQARSLGRRNGQIVIDGGTEGRTVVTGQLDASGRAAGETGGRATVLGREIELAGSALIDASGSAGGGDIRVGGGFHGQGEAHNAQLLNVGQLVQLRADALERGDGGRIALWSDGTTTFRGQGSARGGALGGDGGFAEVSGKGLLSYRGLVDLRAPAGRVGTLLLDPTHWLIVADDTGITPPADTSVIELATLYAQLDAAAVELFTDGNITLQNAFSYTGAHQLTLRAGLTLDVQANISVVDDMTLRGSTITLGSGITLSGANISLIVASGGLVLPDIQATGWLKVQAPGAITQVAGKVLSVGADGNSFSGSSITLGNANLLGGHTVALTAATGDIALKGDAFTYGSISTTGDLSLEAGTLTRGSGATLGAKDITLTSTGASVALELGDITATGKLVASAGGALTQASGTTFSVGASGNSFSGSSIALGNANLLGGHAVALVSAGNIALKGDAFTYGSISTSGDLSLEAGTLTRGSSATLGGKDITLTSTGASVALELGDITAAGKLVASADGALTQAASTRLSVGAAGNSFSGSSITLDNANEFAAYSVALNTAGAASITGSNGLHFGTVSAGSLIATATTGSITQEGGTVLTLGGNSSFTSSDGSAITLLGANVLGGHVMTLVSSAGNLALKGDDFKFASITTTGDISLEAGTLVGDGTVTLGGRDITLKSTGTGVALELGDITATGKLVASADGALTQAASTKLIVGAAGNSFSGSSITLDNANEFAAYSVALNTAGAASITGSNGLHFGGVSAGSLIATATTGSITQEGGTALTLGGNSSFTSSDGSAITLLGANVLGGHVITLVSSAGNISLKGDDFKFASITTTGDISLEAGTLVGDGTATLGGRDITLKATGTGVALELGDITATGKLVASADGALTQAASTKLIVGAAGNSFSGSSITLDNANEFAAYSVALNTAGAASITGSNGLHFGSVSAGALTATATTGSISQETGTVLTLGGNSSFTATDGSAITLLGANVLGGHVMTLVSSAGNLALKGDSFKFASLSTTGDISLEAGTLAADTGATLSGKDITLTATGAGLDLGAVTATGKLVASASGALTQASGTVLTVGTDGNSFSGSSIVLTEANALGANSVALNSAGAASITGSTALHFDTVSVGGSLTAVATAGAITQASGTTITLGADSSFTSSNGSAITLLGANVLGGHVITLVSSAGNLALKGDSFKFASLSTTGDISLEAGTLAADTGATLNARDITLTATGTGVGLELAGITAAGKLVASADGALTQRSGTAFSVGAGGNSFSGSSITLTGANLLGNHSVTLASSGNISLVADAILWDSISTSGDLSLEAGTLAGNVGATLSARDVSLTTTGALHLRDITATGKLLASAGGALTQASGTRFSVGADGSSFSGSSIALGQANVLDGFTVALIAAAGNITLKGDAFTYGSVSTTGDLSLEAGTLTRGSGATLSARDVTLASTGSGNALELGGITASGRLSASADGALSQASGTTLSVGAAGNSFSGSSIALGNANLFGTHSVALTTTTGDATVTSANTLVLGHAGIAGKLIASATGALSQASGATLAVGADGNSFSGSSITLTEGGNAFGGHSVGLNTAGAASITGSTALHFDTVSVGGALTAVATAGAITQASGTTITLGADSSFTSSNGSSITLLGANVLGGHVITLVSSAGNLALKGDSFKFASLSTTGDISLEAGTLARDTNATLSGRDITLAATGAGLDLGAVTATGKLVASASGALTQASGTVLNLGADGNSFSGSSLTLTNANLFGSHSVALTTTSGDASVTSANTLALGTSNVAGKLVASATGALSQASGTTLTVGAGGNSFSGSSLTLDQANVFGSHSVALTTAGDAAITSSNALVLGAASIGGKLVASATGALSQANGTTITVGAGGNSFSGSAITLTQANVLGANSVALTTTTGDAAITSSNALVLGNASIAGKLNASASGAISQAAGTSISVGAGGNTFSGSSLALGNTGNLFGANSMGLTTTAGDAAIRSGNALVLGNANIAGKLTATATGALSQASGSSLTVGATGNSFSGSAITLDQANAFGAHSVALSSSGDADVRSSSTLVLGTASLGGKLTATAAGAITQATGSTVTVGTDGSTFSGSAITLDKANVFGSHTVGFSTTAGDATVNANRLNFGDTNIAGKLIATATGAVTQATGSVISVGADGNSFNGGSITLLGDNLFGGHSVSLTSTGDIGLKANSFKFATISTSGDLELRAGTLLSDPGATLNARNITLVATAGNLDIGQATATGWLQASASGALTQSGLISVNADGNSFAGSSIALGLANVFNGKTVALASSGDAAIHGNALNFAASSVGGKLTASTTSGLGAITQSGALTLGADGSSFSGSSIALEASNVFNGKTVAFSSSGDTTVRADALRLAASTIGGKLVAEASGAISQAGVLNLGADGSRFTAASIALMAANVFNGKTVALSSTGDAAINGNALKFATSNVGGKLSASTTGGTGAITQTGALTLGADDSTFSGSSITLGEANVFNGKRVGFSSSGATTIKADALNFAASTITGVLTAQASGAISQSGVLTLGTDGNSFNAASITLGAANVLNGKTVALTSSGNAVLNGDALKLATSTIAGQLNASTTGGTGAITQTGVLTLGADGSSFSGSSITLGQANVFNGHTVAFTSSGDTNVKADALDFAASTIGGKLVAQATGAITQASGGVISVGADGNSFSASSIVLMGDNLFGGRSVALTSTGDARLKADAFKFGTTNVGGDLSLVAGSLTADPGTTLSGRNVTVQASAGSLVLPQVTASGWLRASATGTLTQAGLISVGADGSQFQGSSITLGQANLFNGHALALTSSGDVLVRGDALDFATSTIGGKLNATASGAITQSGVLTLGADGSTFNGSSITLDQANLFNGKTVAFTSSGDTTVLADVLRLAASTVGGKLVATAGGAITQAGAFSVGADGNHFSGSSLTLDAANLFNGKTVALTTGGNAVLKGDALKLAASSVGGQLNATATGAITQSGVLTLGADGSTFSGSSITLDRANLFNGKTVAFTSAGDTTVHADVLRLAASTVGGKLVAQASGAISQAGLLSLGADGNAFSGSSITLDQANLFHGKTVALTSSGDATLNGDTLNFATSSVGGKLTASTTGGLGDITQTGTLTLGADGSAFSGGRITLDQANLFGGKTVAFTSSGDTTVRADALNFAASTIAGKLVAQASGAITQAGVLSLGADGNSFSGSAITLDQANLFHGKTVALASSGDAVIRGDALNFAASTMGGKLIASTAGAITQSGALSLGADGSQFNAASITLGGNNLFHGKSVALASGGDALVTADALNFAASAIAGKLVATAQSGGITQGGVLAIQADGSRFTTLAAGQDIVLDAANQFNGKTVALNSAGQALLAGDRLLLDTSVVAGALELRTGDSLGQVGTLTVGGNTRLGALDADASMDLGLAGNQFGGTVLLTRVGGAPLRAVRLAGQGSLTVGGDAESLTLLAAQALVLSGGQYGQLDLSAGTAITQTGALSVGGLLRVQATGGTALNVDLSSGGAANEFHTVDLAAGGAGFGLVRLQDLDLAGNGLRANGSANALELLAQGGAILGGGRYGSLTVDVGQGHLTQSGTLQVDGLASLRASSGDLLLDAAGNDFNQVAITAARRASLRDANGLDITQAQVSQALELAAPGTLRLANLSGTGSLLMQGSGLLLVDSALAHQGGTFLNAGTLVLQGAAAQVGPGLTTLGPSATLELRDGAVHASALLSQGGLVRNTSGNGRVDGTLTLAADTVFEVASGSSLGLAGAVTEQGGAQVLAKRGAGQLVLAGNDSRSGATRIEQGSLLASGQLSARSALELAAGTTLQLARDQAIGSLAGAGAVALDSHRLSTGADQRSTTFSGSLSGTGGLTKTGGGTLTLSGSNVQTGQTLLQGGGLVLQGGNALADASALDLAVGTTLSLGAAETVGALSGDGLVQLGSHRLTVGADGRDSRFAGTITGSGGLSKAGAGTFTLAGTGQWTGEARVDAGRLVLDAASALAAGNAVHIASGAELELRVAQSLGALNGLGTLRLSGQDLTLGLGDADGQFAGSLVGSGGLNKLGSGTLLLSGSNSFTGAVHLAGGTLALGGGNALADSARVAVDAGTTLELRASETLAGLSGTGQVSLGAGSRLSLGNDGADSLFAGRIGGAGSLAKQGAGTLVLTGNNDYSGGTRIEAGTLQVGQGGSSGALGSGEVAIDGLLRWNRSDAVVLDNALTGSGGLTLAQGQLTLTNGANSYRGATRVDAGELITRGDQRLSDASAVSVAAGARLTLGGQETVASLLADGMVTLRGNFTSTAEARFRGGLTLDSATGLRLQATTLEALSASNQLGSQPLSLSAGTVQLRAPQDLVLGDVSLTQGGQISAERLTLQGTLALTGGNLKLEARATPDDAKAQAQTGVFVPGTTGQILGVAETTLAQTQGSRLQIGTGAALEVTALGSVNLAQDANRVEGSISVLSGAAFNTAWSANVRNNMGVQSVVKLSGEVLQVGGAGVEADLIEIRAGQLATTGSSRLAARLPYDNLLGTSLSQPGLLLELLPSAFGTPLSFGAGGEGGIRVAVGGREIGNRTDGLDAGYLTIRPKGGAQGATAIYLLGLSIVPGGYSFFHDGSGKAGELPVFYNNVLPAVPQVTSALSSVAAVSESARRDRFDEAVRTENVTVRLRAGVIAEVGPGRAATVGTGGALAPPTCTPQNGALSCDP